MKPTLRHLTLVGLWLASGLLAYSVGRITAGGDPRASLRKQPAPAPRLPSENAETAALFAALRERNASTDSAALTVERITSGRPMGEWLKHLLSQDDEIIRMTGFVRLLEALNTPADIEKALEVVSEMGGRFRGSRGREYSMLLQKWTELDPKGAIAYAARTRGNDDRFSATSTVLRTWTRLRPDEALAWAQANGQSLRGENANANEQEGNWAVSAVVAQLARTDLSRALDVAAAEQPSRARGRIMDTLISELISQRGEEAARESVMNLPSGSFRDAMTAELAGRLANSDPPGAAEWVMSLPAGEARSRALVEVVDEWSEDDAVAAGTFLSRFPLSPESDPLRERYAWNVLRADPEGALAWAATISMEEQRMRAMENLVRTWMRRDAPAAKTWVAQSQLPDQLKVRLVPGG